MGVVIIVVIIIVVVLMRRRHRKGADDKESADVPLLKIQQTAKPAELVKVGYGRRLGRMQKHC